MGRTYTLFNLDQMTGFYFYLSWITVFAVLCHPESLYSAFSYSVSFILFNELQNLEVSHFRALVSRRKMYACAIPTVITPGTLRLVWMSLQLAQHSRGNSDLVLTNVDEYKTSTIKKIAPIAGNDHRVIQVTSPVGYNQDQITSKDQNTW